jgi:outer membrane protein assembly factor BamB
MTTPSVRTPGGAGYLWGGVVLLLVFFVLTVYQLQADRDVFKSNPDLIAELSGGKALEDVPPTAEEGWPQWRGPRRDGRAASRRLAVEWSRRGPPEKWRVDGGDGYSSLAVVAGRVVTMMRSGDDKQEQIVCWDASTGKELWRQGYETPWPGDRAPDYGPGPRATPTIDRDAKRGDRVYTVGVSGLLQCRALDDGRLLWKHDLPNDYQAAWPKWGISGSPLVEGGLLVVSPGGSAGALAFDKFTGVEVWKSADLQEAAGYSSPVAATFGKRRQIVALLGKAVAGLDAATGRLLWRYPWPTEFEVNAATPIVYHDEADGRRLDYVFITSGYAKGCALLKIVADGEGGFTAQLVFETNRLCSHFGSPVRHGDHVYGFNETKLVCLSLRTGEVRWEKSGFHKGSLLLCGDKLVVLGEMGHLALLEASPDGYKALAEGRPLQGRCWSMPALADGLLYIRDQARVLCFDLTGP